MTKPMWVLRLHSRLRSTAQGDANLPLSSSCWCRWRWSSPRQQESSGVAFAEKRLCSASRVPAAVPSTAGRSQGANPGGQTSPGGLHRRPGVQSRCRAEGRHHGAGEPEEPDRQGNRREQPAGRQGSPHGEGSCMEGTRALQRCSPFATCLHVRLLLPP